MGNVVDRSSPNSEQHIEEDWPWVWAIRDPEQLDWKRLSTTDDMAKVSALQAQLPVRVGPGLFLSDARRAHDVQRLVELGITHVLNVAGKGARGPKDAYDEAGIISVDIEADDEQGYPMLQEHLGGALELIADAQAKGGSAVVHCAAGINRSGVIVSAALMLGYGNRDGGADGGMTVLEAVRACRVARGNCFLWNETFQEELVALARTEGRLGPKPGDPGSIVLTSAPPFDRRDEGSSKRAFKAADVKGLF